MASDQAHDGASAAGGKLRERLRASVSLEGGALVLELAPRAAALSQASLHQARYVFDPARVSQAGSSP